MSVGSSGGRAQITKWSRILGVTLRPWSGHSPLSMVLGGGIQVAICLFFLVAVPRMLAADGITSATAEELGFLRSWIWLAVLGLVATLIVGAAKLLVGILDFVPRREVVGTVVSMRQRSTLDFLPYSIRRMIFEGRSSNSQLTRLERLRHEVVVQTADGAQQQWTVRKGRTRRQLTVGYAVRLLVTPITGHVARVEAVPRSGH